MQAINLVDLAAMVGFNNPVNLGNGIHAIAYADEKGRPYGGGSLRGVREHSVAGNHLLARSFFAQAGRCRCAWG
jgi:hypothetical protein